jgi:hypothetical protein
MDCGGSLGFAFAGQPMAAVPTSFIYLFLFIYFPSQEFNDL